MRGIAASWVIEGPPDAAPQRDGAVVLDDDARVVAVGPAAELQARHPGATWERHDAVLMPGLVNAHLHLELCRLRGEVPGGKGFVPWVEAMLAARARLRPEADVEAIDAGVGELLRSGTVAVGEVTNSLAAVEALSTAPLIGRVFHEVFAPGMGLRDGQQAEQEARAQRRERGSWPANLDYALAPHTPYTLHPEVLASLVAEARARAKRTSLHLAEHAAERAYLKDGGGPFADLLAHLGVDTRDWPAPGTDPIRYANDLGALDPEVMVVHLADAREDELALVADAQAPVVLCPRSNLHIQVKLPPLPAMLKAGIRPGLGTDSLASNHSLDVLAEAVALRNRFASVPPAVLLAMVTCWGADALGMPHRVGRFAEGLQPGVLAFEHARGRAPDEPCGFVLDQAGAARRVLARGPRQLCSRQETSV